MLWKTTDVRISNTRTKKLASTKTGRPLPSLPSEIINNICNLLYYLESDNTPSTVQRFINDPSTPAALRRLVLRDIPVVVASGGGGGGRLARSPNKKRDRDCGGFASAGAFTSSTGREESFTRVFGNDFG